MYDDDRLKLYRRNFLKNVRPEDLEERERAGTLEAHLQERADACRKEAERLVTSGQTFEEQAWQWAIRTDDRAREHHGAVERGERGTARGGAGKAGAVSRASSCPLAVKRGYRRVDGRSVKGVDGQRKCPPKWPAKMSLEVLAMVSGHSVLTAGRFIGGLSACMYFFAVSRWMASSRATLRIDRPLRFAFCTAFHLAV